MTTSIFVRSYEKDFPWLAYCLRSIHKFATGFQEVVVCIPEGTDLNLTAERVVKVKETCEGYVHQQISKLNADLYTAADNVVYLDSDCVLTKPLTPEDLMTDGKPDWLITPMDKVGEDARKAWFDVMKDCIGHPPEFEMMRRHPQMIPAWALVSFKEFIRGKHGKSMEAYAAGRPHRNFSEFNVMGFYLHAHHHDKINWLNTDDGVPEPLLIQAWSHGGITPEIKQQFEDILS